MVSPQKDNRVSKIDTYLNCAEVFAYRSTCIKRKYGAVIVKDDPRTQDENECFMSHASWISLQLIKRSLLGPQLLKQTVWV